MTESEFFIPHSGDFVISPKKGGGILWPPQKRVVEFCDPPPTDSLVPPAVVNDVSLICPPQATSERSLSQILVTN